MSESELQRRTDSLSMLNDTDNVQYKEWIDSLRSRVSRCLEQVNLFKLVDETIALLVEAQTHPIAAKDTELVTESLFQLTNQLSIPADLNQQFKTLRSRLDNGITEESLWQLQTEIGELASIMRERLEKEIGDLSVFLQGAIHSIQELQSSLHQINDVKRVESIQSTASTLNTQFQSFQKQADKQYECINKEKIGSIVTAQSDIDHLTGIANHAAFDKWMAHVFAHWKRYGAWLSLVITEVDQFDQIKISFGPNSSNRLLKALAVVLNREVRETDVLACFGKGGFALLLP